MVEKAVDGPQNGGAEASMEWILAHMDDADLNDALPDPSAAAPAPATAAFSADPEALAMLSSMGFTNRQVVSRSPCKAIPPDLLWKASFSMGVIQLLV